MNEIKVKYALGIFMVLSHLVIILLIIWLYLFAPTPRFLPNDFTTVLGIVAPIFAGYTTAVIRFIAQDRNRSDFSAKKVTITYVCGLFLFPLVFFSVLFTVIWNVEKFPDFEDFKRVILGVESLFAGYAGLFFYSQYERTEPDQQLKASEGSKDAGNKVIQTKD